MEDEELGLLILMIGLGIVVFIASTAAIGAALMGVIHLASGSLGFWACWGIAALGSIIVQFLRSLGSSE